MKKQEKKTGNLIYEKPPKFNKETRRKTNHLYIAGVKNLQNLARKMVKENLMLINWG